MRTLAALVGLAVISVASVGQIVLADAFSCSGAEEGGWCWLSNPRLTDRVTWYFTDVPTGGALPLVLEGVANDICETCEWGRDVLVRLYYRAAGDLYWQRTELWLRNVSPEPTGCLFAYPVRGETRILPTGPTLEIIAQRVLSCDPHVGFSRGSLTLGAALRALTPPPVPTLPVEPPLPPPPPPPPPEPTCSVGPLFNCTTGDPPPGCLPEELDLTTVARETLLESFGPGENAVLLQPGHYVGSLGEGNYQDWYRIKTTYGNAFIVWVDPGDLVLDVYIVHDPCGDVLAQCQAVRSATTSVAPCYPGMDCNSSPCYLEGECSFLIRIVLRSGSGEYKLSILDAVP